jgi:leader peptidase (prepilin peptidase) / N-methyltransferase
MAEGLELAVTLFLGLCLGSFATALSWRLPRGVSISVERSRCPSCKRALGIPDLVPVFSWLFLRGRCRGCKAGIGWRYPVIELATLLLCLGFYARFGFSGPTLVLFGLAPVLVAMADIDLEFKILPDALNFAVGLLGLAALIANGFVATDALDFIERHFPPALGGAGLYALTSVALRQGVKAALKKDPLGWGDVKFFAAAGFWLGPDLLRLAHFMCAAGLAGTVMALAWRHWRREAEFPFGPALLAAFVLVLLLEPPLFIFQ